MGGVIVANVTNFLSVTYQTKGLEIEGYALARCIYQEIHCMFESCLDFYQIFIYSFQVYASVTAVCSLRIKSISSEC